MATARQDAQPRWWLGCLALGTMTAALLARTPGADAFVPAGPAVGATAAANDAARARRPRLPTTTAPSLPLPASEQPPRPLMVLHARAKSSGEDGAGKKSGGGGGDKKKAASSSSSAKKKAESSASASAAAAASSASGPGAKKRGNGKHKMEEGSPLYDEALLDGGVAEEMYRGDKTFNLMGQSEDVVAPWSVDGFEIELPDWRPQPSQRYEIVDPAVLEQLGKIENMFGASLRLVSTADGVWRFLYMGNIRNIIGAEAWTKLLLQEDLKIPGVKEVRFETNYVRDYPDDWN